MGSISTLEPLYTSAPILDYDDEVPVRAVEDDELHGAPGVMTLAPEAFDAAILEVLIHP